MDSVVSSIVESLKQSYTVNGSNEGGLEILNIIIDEILVRDLDLKDDNNCFIVNAAIALSFPLILNKGEIIAINVQGRINEFYAVDKDEADKAVKIIEAANEITRLFNIREISYSRKKIQEERKLYLVS